MTFRIGSLFAGIGGLELGLERAGVGRTAWQVERDPYASAVLAKHWPEAKRHDDVTTFPPDDGTDWSADVICGGFPCQDLSYAGKGAGIDGARSGLWREYARIVRLLRPRVVVVENVPALLSRGLGRVLGDLAACGYDAEWDCVPASAVGAPHIRDRLFVVAYRPSASDPWAGCERGMVADAARGGQRADQDDPHRSEERDERNDVIGGGEAVADADREFAKPQQYEDGHAGSQERQEPCGRGPYMGDPDRASADALAAQSRSWRAARESSRWEPEPDVGRVAHGVPRRVDRLKCLGNAVVPQVAEVVGRRLLAIAGGMK